MSATLHASQDRREPNDFGDPHGDGRDPQHGKRGRMIRWFLLVFLIFAVLGIYSLAQRRTEHKVLAEQTEHMAVPYVSVIHASTVTGESELVLPGNINSYVNAPIYARTNGYLKKWYKDIGSHVNKGELLAEIESPEVDAQLAQARADLATAQANVKLSALTAARYQALLKSDSVTQQEVDNFNGDYSAKQAMVQSSEANVKRLEDLESFKFVYAPFAGVITARNVDIGTLINAGNGGSSTKEMFDLAQTDPLRVYVSVPQTYAPTMRAGLKACLGLSEFPGRTFCGQVVRTSNAVDPESRTLLTEVDVPNPTGTLLQGEYAQVRFAATLSGKRLTLPINALLFRPEGTMAAVVGDGSRITLKKLTTGRDLGNSVEVLDGIAPEDAVVINPPDALENGEQVSVTAGQDTGQNAAAPGGKPSAAPAATPKK
jgi:RND family efflux transporter MFP subunit